MWPEECRSEAPLMCLPYRKSKLAKLCCKAAMSTSLDVIWSCKSEVATSRSSLDSSIAALAPTSVLVIGRSTRVEGKAEDFIVPSVFRATARRSARLVLTPCGSMPSVVSMMMTASRIALIASPETSLMLSSTAGRSAFVSILLG